MRVLINTLTAIRQRTGIGHYVQQLLNCLRGRPDVDVVEFPDATLQGWMKGRPTSVSPGRSGFLRPWFNRVGRTLAAWHFQMFARRHGFDVYHEPNFIPLPCGRPTVATLHDLSVVLQPQWHPADRVRHLEKHLAKSLTRCEHFLTVSDFCRQEMMHHLGIPAHKITRVYNGVRPEFRPQSQPDIESAQRRLGLPADYLLHVGTLEPRKNVLLLMQAYCRLPAEVRLRCPLLLAGGWGWKTKELVDFYEGTARHLGVRHIGYLADENMPAVYGGARALLFPSFYEGFGLPPIEMLATGGAVLASTAGALREVLGGHAHLIDPHDLDGWRTAMLHLMDNDWRNELARGGAEFARRFTWQKSAAETLAVYRAVASGSLASSSAA